MSVTNTCYLYRNVCFPQRFSYLSVPLTLKSSPFCAMALSGSLVRALNPFPECFRMHKTKHAGKPTVQKYNAIHRPLGQNVTERPLAGGEKDWFHHLP